MSSVSISSVVSVMLDAGGGFIITDKTRIANFLNVDGADLVQWDRAYNSMNLTAHELFGNILGRWVSREGSFATIGSLANKLIAIEHRAAAEAVSGMGSHDTKITFKASPGTTSVEPPSQTRFRPDLEEMELSRNVNEETPIPHPKPSPAIKPLTWIMDTIKKDELRLERAEKWKTYKVLAFLGSGSFGFVFKIQKDPVLVTPTAVKIIVDPKPFTGAASDDVIEANRELQSMKALDQHDNVVQLISCDVLYPKLNNILRDFGEAVELRQSLQNSERAQYVAGIELSLTCNTIVIEMELCGPTLREWLILDETIGKMRVRSEDFPRTQFDIAQGIINGLKHLHDNKLMHRDLKPENIYFRHLQGNVINKFLLPVKIGDLGLSRQISGNRSVTETVARGTRIYRAPEVATGKYGRQADLYSLGLVLWELFDVIPYSEIEHKFPELVYGRNSNLITKNPWVPNLAGTILSLTMRECQARTKSINDVNLEFKSHSRESSNSYSNELR